MRLSKISIDGLFGIYKYEIKLINPKTSRVTIIDAPNGMGKTTLLKLIQATINGDLIYVYSIPFSSFRLDFDNKKYIEVRKGIGQEKEQEMLIDSLNSGTVARLRNYAMKFSKLNNEEEQEIKNSGFFFIVNGKEYKVVFREDLWKMLLRNNRIYHDNNDSSSLSDYLVSVDYNEYASEDVFKMDELSQVLNEVASEFNIHFIKTNRLYREINETVVKEDRFTGRISGKNSVVSSVELYRDKIKSDILSVGKEFADKSEELDRTFPNRVLKTIFHESKDEEIYDKETIEGLLADLEKRRLDLSELGLITEVGDTVVQIPEREVLTEETRIFLTKYIEDNITKLEIYKEFATKLNLLRSIVNERNVFSDKVMKFSAANGVEFISKNGRPIPIDKLSSGEKNNFILFYELIFECGNHSLVLVDEPEISLHVGWQRQFIEELNEICQLLSLQGIVATHSPDIVGDNIDVMVDLEDMNDVEF